jgi:radical SAM-linked protein
MEQGQRLYIVFSRGRRLRFLSHLDMMRLWERALRRARLPLRYSQGYHPHPRLSLALPLAVGMTAAAEWLECALGAPVAVDEVFRRLHGQLPAGIALERVVEAPWRAPALAASLRASHYLVHVRHAPPLEAVRERVRQFCAASTWVVQEERKGRVRSVDLRALVGEVELGPEGAVQQELHLVLRHEAGRSARVEAVLRALGLGTVALVHRQGLTFDGLAPAERGGAVAQ